MLKWFTSMRGNNIPIEGTIVLEKALEFAKVFNYDSFKACNRWFRSWEER